MAKVYLELMTGSGHLRLMTGRGSLLLMTTLGVWTPPPGLGYPVMREMLWSGIRNMAISGKQTDISLYSYPRYRWTIDLNVLRAKYQNGGAQEMQNLHDLIASLNGGVMPFLYDDPDDDTAPDPESGDSVQNFDVGDGATTQFQLARSRISSGFLEPVYFVNGSSAPVFYVNNSPVSATLGTGGVVTFAVAPGVGDDVGWSGKFYWLCKFDMGAASGASAAVAMAKFPFNKMMLNLWDMKKLNFESVKLP